MNAEQQEGTQQISAGFRRYACQSHNTALPQGPLRSTWHVTAVSL